MAAKKNTTPASSDKVQKARKDKATKAEAAPTPAPPPAEPTPAEAAETRTIPAPEPTTTATPTPAERETTPKDQDPPDHGAKADKLSALDAAVKVLGETGRPMNCPELIAAMAARGYWASPRRQE
jgi:hypothetical protein